MRTGRVSASCVLVGTSTLTFGSVDEVRGDVTAVKLHALNDLQLIVQSLPILTCKACTDYVTLQPEEYMCCFSVRLLNSP